MSSKPTQAFDKPYFLKLTQELLDSIAQGDYNTYTKLCSHNLTCFEPEARGNLVAGLDFHKYYFDLKKADSLMSAAFVQTTMVNPQVIISQDMAIVTYVRLIQKLDTQGHPKTLSSEETRVWQRLESDEWKLVHFHRSLIQ